MSLLGNVGDFLKKAAKGVVGALGGFVAGGPVGAVVGGVGGLLGGNGSYNTPGLGSTAGLPAGAMNFSGANNSMLSVIDPRVSGSVGDWLVPDFVQAPTDMNGAGVMASARGAGRVPCIYQLRDGTMKHGHYGRGGKCVPNRRMNPLNPRAARRSIRRIKAVRRISQNIERALPKARTTRRRSA
jgi:hypothetical protein